MKAADTLIAWNANTTDGHSGKAPPGSIGIGPLTDFKTDWSAIYHATGGASFLHRRKLFGMPQQFYVMREWYMLVYCYGIDPYLAHRAFLLIDEYQTIIKDAGWGPAKGEPGHESGIPYGRAIRTPPPQVRVIQHHGATHFWPEFVEAVA